VRLLLIVLLVGSAHQAGSDESLLDGHLSIAGFCVLDARLAM
jgi:hypothetical protein